MNDQVEGSSVISPQRLLEPKEVAQQLNVSPAFIYKLIKAGSLPAVRISTTVRIDPEDLREFLKKSRTAK
jgi:excisionase family DNA binding protein